MSDRSIETFWALISEHPISIPIIQRDYAQGRRSVEITQIRSDLLASIQQALVESTSLDFDFIYGSIEGNTFIPLDGQQRLTTLFLLHWYLANKEGKLSESISRTLERFSYDTRHTAAAFCKALITQSANIDGLRVRDIPVGESLSAVIEDASWFYLSWRKDPTIRSMLVMLDWIHDRFISIPNVFDLLTDPKSKVIHFRSMLLENFGLSDILYIKMNGRGKPLTEFETFKARFEQLLEEKAPHLKDDFSQKMDGTWTDLFWKYRDQKTLLFDKEFMNFFRTIGTNTYAINNEPQAGSLIVQTKLTATLNPIGFTEMKQLGCFSEQGIDMIIQTLDLLSDGSDGVRTFLKDGKVLDEKKLFREAYSGSREFGYAQRIQFYAITQYVILHGSSAIDEWARVIRNFTSNIAYNGADEYIRDMRAIYAILPSAAKILDYLSVTPINGFMRVQRDEEMLKAQLIKKSDTWRTAIFAIESHGYLNGQIGFLLKFAGVDLDHHSWSEIQDRQNHDRFIDYCKKFQALFSTGGLKDHPDHLFERALLAKGDYLITHTLNKSFLINNHREVSWKRFFRDDSTRRDVLKYLLDEIDDSKPITAQLLDIVNAEIKNNTCELWRHLFIRHAKMISVCGNERYIRFNNSNDILLLSTSRTSGYHYECYSFALHLRLRELGYQSSYRSVSSKQQYAGIDSIEYQNIEITYYWYENQWQFKIVTATETTFQESEDDVMSYLYSHNVIKF